MPRSFRRWLLLYCMWIMVFKGCRSFFLRHNQTGKCVTASEELVYNSPSYAKPYFVVMTDNCLNGSAQFRYLNTGLLQNIVKGGTLVSSPKTDDYHNRWAVYKGSHAIAIKYEERAEHRLKQTAAGSLSFYSITPNPVCAEPSSSSEYLLRKLYCDTKKQNFTFGSVTAYNATMKDVQCSPIQLMQVKKADYGNFDQNGKFKGSASIDRACSIITNCRVKSLCGGNRSCELTIDDNILLPQYCSDTLKEIYTEYTCVDKTSFITGPNVRLSQSPNEGFIEIKDGPTWRKVDEENWDKDRQKMLCQHLGFGENTNTSIDNSSIASREQIARGHLICYEAHLYTEISCCICLEPFTTPSETTIPYVTCGKLCDRPLLKNLTMFPDAVFSGGGGSSDYHQARFYGDGWCSSGSATDYLLIDLKNDYHITLVVTMGDKNQTKWSNSYSLKCNHTESLVDGSTAVKITGNQNGYQPSTTSVDIYNARFIKIQSVNTNFCLRIELCGEVQSPAPVQNFTTKPSNFSVNLSWTIPEKKVFSYSTHFIIYLNDTLSDGIRIVRISRVEYGNEFVLHGLKPVTEYTVGIQAQDSSSKNATIVYQNFKTKEAVPSGPPLNVTVKYRTSDSLGISWKAPHKHLWNGKLTGYQVCYSSVTGENQNCLHTESSGLSLNIPNLQPSTKYFLTVAASTKIGYGNKSLEISKITNGVQSLAPVQNFTVNPSNFSVHLSWTIPGAKSSNYNNSTHFIIYLNGTQSDSIQIQRIFRLNYGNEFVLHGLKPITEYTVGIQAQDSTLKNSTIVFQDFKTEEAVPSGPPLNLAINFRISDSLRITWEVPEKNLWNGELTAYQVCHSFTVFEENQNCLHTESSVLSLNIPNLQPSTKYFLTVAASTKIGYGNKSLVISEITNGEPINPVAISNSSLNITLVKQAKYIKQVMVIVQIAPKTPTPVEDIQTNELKPYKTDTQDPYIAAYFKADILPFMLIIGDGKEYNFGNKRYYNHPLKQDSSYIVFLRFFETNDSYYSTEWSKSVKTMKKPPGHSGPPLNVTLKSSGKNSLDVFWKVPDKNLQNSALTGYQVCFYTSDLTPECLALKSTKVLSLTLNNLRPATKYFVTVSAITKAGYGEKSLEVSKITNGEPINPLVTSYYTLSLHIPKQKNYIREVMVIVESSIRSSVRSENLMTNDLKTYQTDTEDPYVAAYFKADVLPLTFIIGDGKEYNSEDGNYTNQPLKQDTNYIVFLRFFEKQWSYYSTEWSGNVKTMIKLPEECVSSQNAKQSNEEKIRMDLIIPLVVSVLCFLISLGLNIYQRRLITNRQPCHSYYEPEVSPRKKKFDHGSKSDMKDVKASPEHMYMNNVAVYESPDSVMACIKQNEAESQPELSTGQESSTYMSLKDNKEPGNVYQSLQPSSSSTDPYHKSGNITTKEYQNPAFDSNSS